MAKIKVQKMFIAVISGLIMTVLMLSGTEKVVHAAEAGIVALQPDKTYKSYDLDGDNKPDIIKLKTIKKYDNIDRIRIKINGKVVYKKSFDLSNWVGIHIITLQNGKKYLYLGSEYGGAQAYDTVMQYRQGKMQEVVNFQEMKELKDAMGWSYISGSAISVVDNSVKVKMKMMNWSVGDTTMDLSFQYKNGKLQMKKKGQMEKKRYKVAKKFPLYKAAGKKAKAFTAKKGEWLTTEKYCIKKGKLYLQFSTDTGKKGWIKSIANPRTGQSPLFTNAYYHS